MFNLSAGHLRCALLWQPDDYAMRWPGFIQKFLYSCYGDRDEPVDGGPVPARRFEIRTQSDPEPPREAAHELQPTAEAGPASSAAPSERHQSEQTQSDQTQATTQPTSVDTSTKVDSDPDEITSAKTSPTSVTHVRADPDEITPVEPKRTMYTNVSEALEDRKKMFDRLRRRPDDIAPPTEIPPRAPSTSNGSKATAP